MAALPTRKVTCRLFDQQGLAAAKARIQFRLTATEIIDGIVAPEMLELTADENGVAVFDLVPNVLGVNGTQYQVRAWNPDTGKKFIDGLCTVQDQDSELHDILFSDPPPTVDVAQQAVVAAQGYALSAGASAVASAASAQASAQSNQSAINSAAAAATSESNAANSKVAAAASEAMALRVLPVRSATPPPNPLEGGEWIHSITGRKYTWVIDADSSQWVEVDAAMVVDNPALVDELRTDVEERLDLTVEAVRPPILTSVDAAPALWLADQSAPVTLKQQGYYRIAQNLTFTRRCVALSGVKLYIEAGVNVHFAKSFSGPDEQIFYGPGTVSGLKKNRVMWFAGDNLNSAVNSRPLVQKCLDGTALRGDVRWLVGTLFSDGEMTNVSFGQRIRGYGQFHSHYCSLTSKSNGFAFMPNSPHGGGIEGMQVGLSNPITLPTEGYALQINSPYVRVKDFVVDNAYKGVDWGFGGIGGYMDNFKLLNCWETGLSLHDLNDVFVSNFLIVNILDRFTVANKVGEFQPGESLVGSTSGSTASSVEVSAANLLRAHADNENFIVGETITGSVSGATAILQGQEVGHRLGGIRLENKVEAFIASNGDVIGGRYSMTTDAANNLSGSRPAYNKLNSIYFDSADEGCLFNKSIVFDFNSCWFSHRPGRGAALAEVEGFTFNGGGAINCFQEGLVVSGNARDVYLNGFHATGNSMQEYGTFDGLKVEDGAKNVHVTGGRYGGSVSFGTQRHGICFESGITTDNYSAVNANVLGNALAGIMDGGSEGATKHLAYNTGYKTTARGASQIAVGQSVATITHGLSVTPTAADVTVGMTSFPGSSGVTSVWATSFGPTTFEVVSNASVAGTPLQVTWSARCKGA